MTLNFKNLLAFAVNMEQPNKLKTKKFFTDLNIQKLEIFFDQNLNFVKEFKLRGVPTTILINKKVINKIKTSFKVKKFNILLSISDENKYAIASVIISK